MEDKEMKSLTVMVMALVMGLSSLSAQAAPKQAPFGDKVSPAITYYNRATPFVATAGVLKPGAAAELKKLGFKTILDLRGPKEGVAKVKSLLEGAGLSFLNIPVVTRAPTLEQVKQFTVIVEDKSNYPLLVYCKSANRVGALWAMYRAAKGAPGEVAIEEGRTTGLKASREGAVRKLLGLAPMTKPDGR
ncbi:MAG: sulfur transferase domain-containing protein [Proteobacteria bacterium]|nr:sulfur transferase domain-containing protein [Pseudomonadota bacterium]